MNELVEVGGNIKLFKDTVHDGYQSSVMLIDTGRGAINCWATGAVANILRVSNEKKHPVVVHGFLRKGKEHLYLKVLHVQEVQALQRSYSKFRIFVQIEDIKRTDKGLEVFATHSTFSKKLQKRIFTPLHFFVKKEDKSYQYLSNAKSGQLVEITGHFYMRKVNKRWFTNLSIDDAKAVERNNVQKQSDDISVEKSGYVKIQPVGEAVAVKKNLLDLSIGEYLAKRDEFCENLVQEKNLNALFNELKDLEKKIKELKKSGKKAELEVLTEEKKQKNRIFRDRENEFYEAVYVFDEPLRTAVRGYAEGKVVDSELYMREVFEQINSAKGSALEKQSIRDLCDREIQTNIKKEGNININEIEKEDEMMNLKF